MRRSLTVSLLLIIITIAVFWPATGYDFVSWDDDMFIYENPNIKTVTASNTLNFWKEPLEGLYIPLPATAWSFLAWLSQYTPVKPYGLNPALYHTANLIVHLLSVLVVFSILRMFLTSGFKNFKDDNNDEDSPKIALAAGAGALIFALHPVQVEPVAWASELKDLLCGLFSFLAIREYLAFAVASRDDGPTGGKNRHYLLACAAFLLALFSKPAAVVVPLVLFILDRWAVGRTYKQSAVSLFGWFMVAGLFAVIAKSVQQSGAVIFAPPLWARPFVAGDALAFYFYKLLFPFKIGIDYGRTPDYVLNQWWGYATWLVPFALIVAIWFSRRRETWFVFLGIFAASLLPVLGFVSFLFQNYSTVADHYLYLPMLGVALSVSWLFYKRHTKTVGAICAAAIVLLGLRSSYHLPVWKNETELFLNAIKVNPTSVPSYNNLGLALARKRKFDEAIFNYKKAIELSPNYADAYYNLGNALAVQGKLKGAVLQFKRALSYEPGDADMHYNLAVALEIQGKKREAANHYREAGRIRSNSNSR